MQEEQSSCKALDDLSVALFSVTTEAKKFKVWPSVTQAELEAANAEAERLRVKLTTNEVRLHIVINEHRRCKLETEESAAERGDKEHVLLKCVGATEEEVNRTRQENTKLVESHRMIHNKTCGCGSKSASRSPRPPCRPGGGGGTGGVARRASGGQLRSDERRAVVAVAPPMRFAPPREPTSTAPRCQRLDAPLASPSAAHDWTQAQRLRPRSQAIGARRRRIRAPYTVAASPQLQTDHASLTAASPPDSAPHAAAPKLLAVAAVCAALAHAPLLVGPEFRTRRLPHTSSPLRRTQSYARARRTAAELCCRRSCCPHTRKKREKDVRPPSCSKKYRKRLVQRGPLIGVRVDPVHPESPSFSRSRKRIASGSHLPPPRAAAAAGDGVARGRRRPRRTSSSRLRLRESAAPPLSPPLPPAAAGGDEVARGRPPSGVGAYGGSKRGGLLPLRSGELLPLRLNNEGEAAAAPVDGGGDDVVGRKSRRLWQLTPVYTAEWDKWLDEQKKLAGVPPDSPVSVAAAAAFVAQLPPVKGMWSGLLDGMDGRVL
ncbi:hypothetical protein ACP4OV_020583 [Aristida adscensionis]